MSQQANDERHMRAALREARKGLGRTSPNPAVGAVLVSRNRVIARGHHREPGGPHAEICCLESAPRRLPADATLYVTLEPCSTVGKTGACTEAMIAAGVRNVVIGTVDPNPKHNGRGMALLQRAGCNVRTGILENECRDLNEAFNKWIVTRMPFVIAKCGMSLDGRLTLPPSGSRWITSAASRADAQKLRAQVDAILIGAGTVRADDPKLTVRGVAHAKQPWRVILARSGKLPAGSRVLHDRWKDRTLIYRNRALKSVLKDLGRNEVLSVLIEGGGDILGQALDAGLIDKVQIYVGPVLTGGPVLAFAGEGAASTQEATRLERLCYTKMGPDVRVIGFPGPQAAS